MAEVENLKNAIAGDARPDCVSPFANHGARPKQNAAITRTSVAVCVLIASLDGVAALVILVFPVAVM